MISRQVFRDGMARLGAAVSIVTTDGQGGRGGFTASAVCAVSDDPPTLLVCMNSASAQCATFLANEVLCVNTLTAGGQDLSAAFAGGKADIGARYAGAAWSLLATGAPVLDAAGVSFDCRIAQVIRIGTHHVMFCEIEAIRSSGNDEALIYFARAFHRLVRLAEQPAFFGSFPTWGGATDYPVS